jgi:phospholipid transport system substrate-binding protein
MIRRPGIRRARVWMAVLALALALPAASSVARAERPAINPLVIGPILELAAPRPENRPSLEQRGLNDITPSARNPNGGSARSMVGSQLNTAVVPQAQPRRISQRPSPKSAVQFVKQLARQALGVLNDSSLSDRQRDTRLRRLMREGLNLHLIGKFALGPFWDSADSPMVHEYQKLFGDFVVATYSKHFGRRKVDAITFLGTRQAGRKDVVVNTRFDLAIGIGIPANWRVRLINGQPQIIDVEIAGISMAMTYRTEFITFMERNGGQLDDLVSRLRESPT